MYWISNTGFKWAVSFDKLKHKANIIQPPCKLARDLNVITEQYCLSFHNCYRYFQEDLRPCCIHPQVAFKTDVFKLEGNTVTLNGVAVAVPMHKSYKDGSQIVLEDKGSFLSKS